jgi:hypothetical protein
MPRPTSAPVRGWPPANAQGCSPLAISIVLTTNRGFGDWNQVFADRVVTSAIVDRLLHNATVINIKGHSYRMRRYDGAQKAKGGRAMVA